MKTITGSLLFLLLLIGIVFWTGPALLLATFHKIDGRFLALMLSALVFADLLRAYKYRTALKGIVPFRETFRLFLYSKLTGFVSAEKAGERIPLLHTHERKKEIAAFLMADRAFEALTLFFLGAFGFALFSSSLAVYLVGGVLLGLAILLVVLLYRRNGHLTQFLGTLRDNTASFRAFLVTALALTITAAVADLFALQLLLKSTGAVTTLSFLAFACMASGLAGFASSFPSGLGVSDTVLAVMLSTYGIARAAMGVTVALHRGITLVKSTLYYRLLVFL